MGTLLRVLCLDPSGGTSAGHAQHCSAARGAPDPVPLGALGRAGLCLPQHSSEQPQVKAKGHTCPNQRNPPPSDGPSGALGAETLSPRVSRQVGQRGQQEARPFSPPKTHNGVWELSPAPEASAPADGNGLPATLSNSKLGHPSTYMKNPVPGSRAFCFYKGFPAA